MYDPTINGFSSPNRDWKSKSGVFSNAGRSIAVHDDAIQHNFSYKPSKETLKKEADQVEYERLRQFQNEADLAGLAKVNPTAYGNYVNNLEKMNNNLMKVDAYAEEFNRAKEKLHYDQRNLDSLQKLSKFNADQHKQHIQNQIQRMREPATDRKFAGLRDHPQRKQPQSRGNLAHFSERDYETQNNLLSQFANSNSLDDHLSGFGNDNSRNYGQDLRNYSGNNTPLAQHKQSPYNNPPPQFNVQSSPQFNPYQAPGYGYPPYNPYMPPPNYGYGYPPYQPPQNNNENSEMKYQMQRQNDLLEALTKRITTSRERVDSRHRRNLSSRALDDKFKDYEKETELRLQLMKQQQLIENLQNNNNNQPNQSPDVYNPQTLAQNFMQHLNPFQYGGYDAFSNPYYTPQYNPYGNGYPGYDPYAAYGHSPYKSKKHKSSSKYKKKKAASSDSDDSDKDSDDSDDDDDDKKKKRKSKSSKNDLKVRRPQNKRKTRVDRKNDAKSNLKKVLWCMVYPTIFDTYVSKKVVHRKQVQQRHVDEQFEAFTQNFTTWMMNITQEGFTKLVDDAKKNYDFIGLDFKKLSKSDITKRATDCKTKIKLLFETLLGKTDQYALEPTNLEFLASLCYKPAYIANHTISNFELMRLQYNFFGRVDKQTQEQSEMMISCFLLVRILAYQIIFKASEWNTKPKWTDQLLTNFKIVASIIYHIIKSVWEQEIPVINQNPSKLPNARIAPLLMDPGIEAPQGPSDDPDMILGTLNKTQLAPILEEDKPWMDSMKQLVRQWTHKIHQMLGDYRLKTAAKNLDQEPSVMPLASSVRSLNVSAAKP